MMLQDTTSRIELDKQSLNNLTNTDLSILKFVSQKLVSKEMTACI